MYKPSSKLKEPQNIDKGYEYGVFLLSLQLRTVGEIVAKMKQRGYEQSVVDAVIDRLTKNKYLDDARYAEVYLENLKKYKNFGYYGIKKKLMEKKLPMELIEEVLSEGLSIEDEVKIAKRFLKKSHELRVESYKLGDSDGSSELEENTYSNKTYGEEKDPKEIKKQKTLARLKSRGFRGEVVTQTRG